MDKLRQRQEITAYRIVRRHVLKITNGIPFNNMSKITYTALINANDHILNVAVCVFYYPVHLSISLTVQIQSFEMLM